MKEGFTNIDRLPGESDEDYKIRQLRVIDNFAKIEFENMMDKKGEEMGFAPGQFSRMSSIALGIRNALAHETKDDNRELFTR